MKSKFLLTLFFCSIVSVTAYAYTWPVIEGNDVIQQLCEEESEGFVADGAVLKIDTESSAVSIKAQILNELSDESVYCLKPLEEPGVYALYKKDDDAPVLVAIHLTRQVIDEEDELGNSGDIEDELGNLGDVVDLSNLPSVFMGLDIQSEDDIRAALVKTLKSMKKKYRRAKKGKSWNREVQLNGRLFVWEPQNPKKPAGRKLFGDLCDHIKQEIVVDSWESRFAQALETNLLTISVDDEICTFKCGEYDYKFSLSEQKKKKKSSKKKAKKKSHKDDFEKAGEDTIQALTRVRRVVEKEVDKTGDNYRAFERGLLSGSSKKKKDKKKK